MSEAQFLSTIPSTIPKSYVPKLDAFGTRYKVVRTGPVFEVRRLTYSHGQCVGDQLVCVLMREQEADDMARDLLEKEAGQGVDFVRHDD